MKVANLVESTYSAFGARFSLVALLPASFFAVFLLLLLSTGVPQTSPSLHSAVSKFLQLDAVHGLLVVLSTLAVALILQPFQLALVRLLEGYWGTSWIARAFTALFRLPQRWKRKRLQKRLNKLLADTGEPFSSRKAATIAAQAGRLSERIERFYPKENLQPTALGNVLRAAEEGAGAPYGLDAVTVWPRIYAILPERMAAIVDDQRSQLDVAVRFSATFAMAATVSLILLYPYDWWLMVPFGAAVLAWLSYRAAVVSALAYGRGIRSVVDLHRFDLLRALHLPLPQDRETEKEANAELCEFLRQGRPVNFKYDHTSTH